MDRWPSVLTATLTATACRERAHDILNCDKYELCVLPRSEGPNFDCAAYGFWGGVGNDICVCAAVITAVFAEPAPMRIPAA